MAIARPEPQEPSKASSAPDEPNAGASREVGEPATSQEVDGRRSSRRPAASRPPNPLNQRAESASNAKLARIREAEEDRAFIARAQQGDVAAFRQLVERHQRRAFAIALSLVRDENDARELVQEAFLRVHRGLPSFQGTSSFFTWLYRIVTNLSIDLIRKPGRQLTDIDEARFEGDDSKEAEFPFLSHVDGADPVDVVRRGEIADRLQAALDALPPYHRSVIVMREIEGFSYEEMATAMGVSKGTIMSRLFHARQKLQKALVDCYEEQIGRAPGSAAEDDGGEE